MSLNFWGVNTILSHEKFIEKAKQKNEKVDVIGSYINSATPILVQCRVCKRQYLVKPNVVLQGHGCNKCFGGVKIDQSSFLQRLLLINPQITVLGEYEGQSKKIRVLCNVCNYTWTPTAGSLLQGHGCPRCVGKARISHEAFIKKLNEKMSSIEVLGQFV